MSIPEEIKILGHTYKVTLVDGYVTREANTGRCNSYLNEIHIAGEVVSSNQNEILLHEILEALDYRLELDINHPRIAVLSEALYQVLKDNNLHFRNECD